MKANSNNDDSEISGYHKNHHKFDSKMSCQPWTFPNQF